MNYMSDAPAPNKPNFPQNLVFNIRLLIEKFVEAFFLMSLLKMQQLPTRSNFPTFSFEQVRIIWRQTTKTFIS